MPSTGTEYEQWVEAIEEIIHLCIHSFTDTFQALRLTYQQSEARVDPYLAGQPKPTGSEIVRDICEECHGRWAKFGIRGKGKLVLFLLVVMDRL